MDDAGDEHFNLLCKMTDEIVLDNDNDDNQKRDLCERCEFVFNFCLKMLLIMVNY